MRRRILPEILVFCVLLATPLSAYDNIVVFGDSLSDTGNTAALTGGFSPGPAPYYNGRYSNGPVWTEHLATWFGAELENFAHGGAQAAAGSTFYFPISIPNTGGQFANFQAAQAGATPPTSDLSADLVVIAAGAVNYSTQGETTTAPVDHLSTLIQDIYTAGGREFIVMNLPDLGATPSGLDETTGPTSAALTGYSNAFNAELTIQLEDIRKNYADIELFEFDAFTLLDDAVNNPSTYGLTNVTAAAMSETGAPTDPADPFYDDYLFFDGSHPTAAGHQMLADSAIAQLTAVPEPSVVLMLVIAIGLGGRRRR